MLNRFYDDGWYGRLTATEVAVWHAYFRHAGANNIAFPSAASIAVHLGHSDPSHVKKARRKLESLGLLKRFASAGGTKAQTARVQVLLPTTTASHVGPNPPHEQNIEQNNEHIPEPPRYPPGMLRFWDAYPQRGRDRSSRLKCAKVWKKLRCEPIVDQILTGLSRWKLSDKWTAKGGQYIDNPHGWLEGHQWTESPTPAANRQADSADDLPPPICTQEMLQLVFGK
jgi:hypothetical protein